MVDASEPQQAAREHSDSLLYCFLSFNPPYDFSRVNPAIAEFIEAERIDEFSSHEIFGAVDVIVKVWIPSSKSNRFLSGLNKYLNARNCFVAESAVFNASEVSFHSVWLDERPESPAGVRNGNPDNRAKRWDITDIGEDETRRLLETNWLRDSKEGGDRVRMFISIPPQRTGRNIAVIKGLELDIANTLAEVKLEGAVLYRGVGTHTELLIEAQVPVSNYSVISRFNDKINELGLQRFGLKTTTYLTTKLFTAAKPTAPASAEALGRYAQRAALDYLSADESEVLEHKGSFEFDISRFLARNEQMPNPKLPDVILQTIVAFLNSNGGDLVIGAAEERKFQGAHLEKLKQEFPAIGPMRLIGVSVEYQFAKEKTWDGYQLKILDSIASRIGLEISNLIKLRRVVATSDAGKEVELCVITVAPFKGDLRFLDKERCFVRSGASTRELKGTDLLQYQRSRTIDPQ